MGESSEESQQSFLRRHWEGYKEFWGERFSFLENYSRFIDHENPMPAWCSSDVEDFIASDPVHGPTVIISMAIISLLFRWHRLIMNGLLILFNFACFCVGLPLIFESVWRILFFFILISEPI